MKCDGCGKMLPLTVEETNVKFHNVLDLGTLSQFVESQFFEEYAFIEKYKVTHYCETCAAIRDVIE